METRRLELFVTLVDAGGFKQAADSLFITAPALSQQISRLEKDVGVALIDRTTRPITPTEAGREFYYRCRRVLEAMQHITQLLDDQRSHEFGRVRVGIVPAMMFSSPARAVRQFIRAHPTATVQVRSIGTSLLIDELHQGSIDVAVLLTQPDVKELTSRALFSEDYLVALPDDHPLAAVDEVDFAMLRNERIIQGPRVANPAGYDAVVTACMRAGFSPRSLEVVGSYLDHAAMVSAGMGICFIPKSLADIPMHNVVYRTLVNPSVGLTTSISWFDRRLDAVGRAFVQHCITELSVPESLTTEEGSS
ncbi:LysR family transcriptional regulator [Microbacterium sp. 1.5R]|uniref:LysR family transcriptional regulator n=1 Tax=Microbacterium sp. 1.5R TaxID=1916917 RepID=UPI0011A2619D|nr:LysR family transcriptional regulator [Microbacterium sp. 1.5R]